MEGVLLVNKPKGMTSHDCVQKIRKLLRIKKIGHTGTLDPEVSGVLPICIGKATKIAEYLTGTEKTYEGEVTLGFSTTTEDATGDIVERQSIDRVILKQEIEKIFKQLTGDIEQTPPMYSAVKVKGKRLYEYAREGIEVERPTRKVTIFDLQLLDDREEYIGEEISFRFKVTCSKGTYIRTLAVMIGEKLGYPAHMSDLIRTASGHFTIDQCLNLDEIEKKWEKGILIDDLISIENALSHLPKMIINDKLAEKVKNGAVLPLHLAPIELMDDQPLVMVNQIGQCIAIYKRHPSKQQFMKPAKVLST
jgi:tRNA pseudouridine55 synthase